MADSGQIRFRQVVVEDQQTRGADLHVRRRVDQVDAVQGGGGPLVELAGDVLDGQVFLAFERAFVRHAVGHHLAEDAVAAFLQQLVGEAEQIIDIQEPQGTQVERKVFVELGVEALRPQPELRILFYEDAIFMF